MANLREARRRLATAIAVMAVIALSALAYLIWARNSTEPMRLQAEQLQRERQLKIRQVGPLTGMDQRLATAEKQIDAFYEDRLPGRWSDISDELSRLAREHRVSTANITYTTEETELPALRRITISAPFTGDYGNIARFVNAIERDDTFFVIDGINLTGQSEAGQVSVQLALETYLKEPAR